MVLGGGRWLLVGLCSSQWAAAAVGSALLWWWPRGHRGTTGQTPRSSSPGGISPVRGTGLGALSHPGTATQPSGRALVPTTAPGWASPIFLALLWERNLFQKDVLEAVPVGCPRCGRPVQIPAGRGGLCLPVLVQNEVKSVPVHGCRAAWSPSHPPSQEISPLRVVFSVDLPSSTSGWAPGLLGWAGGPGAPGSFLHHDPSSGGSPPLLSFCSLPSASRQSPPRLGSLHVHPQPPKTPATSPLI